MGQPTNANNSKFPFSPAIIRRTRRALPQVLDGGILAGFPGPEQTPVPAISYDLLMQAIEVVGLTKTYGDFVAVKDFSFELRQGEVLGLVGPNGAGKTTTLRALSGIHPPTSGTIRICGFDLSSEPVEAKRRLAFFPDEPRLFDYLTVEEHLLFTGALYRVEDAREQVEPLLTELELLEKRKALPTELSRGMKQKLMIACGFIHRPEVLIFDEPLTGLDPLGIRRMKESITRRAAAGAAVILSSHLLHLVEELCDTVAIIQNGTRVAYGKIEDLKWQMAQGKGDVSLEEAFLRITSPEAESRAR
jgi:ABC-2 type transport system ATP-binding protein